MTRHLAEFNIAKLVAPQDDPRVAEFMNNIERINTLGKQMPGFVWIMENSGEPGAGNTGARVNNDPLVVSNLTVWEDVESLERFVWGTVHRKFYERRAEWFEVLGAHHFVMWWVEAGHQPSLEEALSRLELRRQNGDSEDAFGWEWLREASLYKSHQCANAQSWSGV